ncbi:MAG: hypothetical protein IPK58_11930 [Acidobacteria bacterium]|nr:hypothetical protein [Acidobacteriota bacterium]
MGRMTSVADADRTYLGGVTFGAKTLPTQIALGNGTVQNFDFNERLQMKSQDLKRGTEVLQKYEYGFGELNPQSQLKNNGKLESVVSYIGSQKQWTQKFSYDSVGRLKEARETRGDNEALSYKQVFEFDRFGNLFRKATSNPTTGQDTPIVFTPIEPGDIDPAKNRFTSASGTAYNDNGQVVTDGKFRNLGYGYDANGRMVRASEANRPDAVSVYDALGNRVAEKVNDVWQFVIYDAFGKLVAEYGGTVPGDEGGVKYYLQDWQGSVRAGVNAAGYVKSRTDHQAFGEDIGSGIGLRTTAQGFGAPASNRQGYGLTEKDSTGLNHTWFRKNENRAGRWTSPDPYNGSASVGNPQSWNRYSYVESQPTNFVDPSGLDDEVPIFRMEVHTWASTFARWWWIFFGVSPVRNGGYIGQGGGGSFGDKCDPDFFADDFIWKVRNLEITGEDLNYAARVVFAEASSIWIPNLRERDDNSTPINRIRCDGERFVFEIGGGRLSIGSKQYVLCRCKCAKSVRIGHHSREDRQVREFCTGKLSEPLCRWPAGSLDQGQTEIVQLRSR